MRARPHTLGVGVVFFSAFSQSARGATLLIAAPSDRKGARHEKILRADARISSRCTRTLGAWRISNTGRSTSLASSPRTSPIRRAAARTSGVHGRRQAALSARLHRVRRSGSVVGRRQMTRCSTRSRRSGQQGTAHRRLRSWLETQRSADDDNINTFRKALAGLSAATRKCGHRAPRRSGR